MTEAELHAVNYMIDSSDYCKMCQFLPKDGSTCEYFSEAYREQCIKGLSKTFEKSEL